MVARDFEQSLAELESMSNTIEKQVRALPAARWEERIFEGENGWNRRQLLAHLATINLRHATRIRMATGAGQQSGPMAPIDDWNAEQVAAREGRSVDELLSEARSNRADVIALLRALTPEQREQFRFPRGDASLTLEEWVPFVLQHDRTHLAEIAG